MKYPEGSIIINKQGERRKVLGACGSVRFLVTVGREADCLPSVLSVDNIEYDGYIEEAPLSFLQLIEEAEKRTARDILDSFFETISLLREEIKKERDNL